MYLPSDDFNLLQRKLLHHVERTRTLLAQHRVSNVDIVRDLSYFKLLISTLAQAQGSDLDMMSHMILGNRTLIVSYTVY